MKILVITDFSETSKQALQYAIDLVAATQGNIELAHVVDDSEDADSAHTSLVNFINQVNTKDIEIKHTVLLGDLYDQVGVYTKMHDLICCYLALMVRMVCKKSLAHMP